MWQGASSDYLQRFNRNVQLAHNPRWAHVREPTRDGVSMLMQYRQGELQEMERMRTENARMHTDMDAHTAKSKVESANYFQKLQGYSDDVTRFKQQYSERVVSHGCAAASNSGDDRPIRRELPDQAVESNSDGKSDKDS